MGKSIFVLAITGAFLALVVNGCEEFPTTPDTDPPTIVLVSPAPNSTATDTLVVVVTASDDRGVARVELYVNGNLTTPVAIDSTSPYRLVASLADLSAGGHTFRAMAVDSAGNADTTDQVMFTAAINPGLKYLSKLVLDGSARDVAVDGSDYAYVASEDGGVNVVDVSNPFVPEFISRFNTNGFTHGVAVTTGNRLLVADGVEGLRVLSFANPDTLVEIGRLTPTGIDAKEVTANVAGTLALVAGGSAGVFAIDITDTPLVGLGVYDQGGNVVDVEISGSYAYTAEQGDGLRVLDISSPDSMFAVDQFATPQAWDVSINSNFAYLAAADNGVFPINISTPSNISVSSAYNPSKYMRGVVASGTKVYLAALGSGVEVVSSTSPTVLAALPSGVFDTDGLSYRIVLMGTYILVADGTSLTILKYID
jgi:hypothetical protein